MPLHFPDSKVADNWPLYFQESLKVFSGDLTGRISHHQLVFVFGKLRLGEPDRFAEPSLAARLTFHGSKIIKAKYGFHGR